MEYSFVTILIIILIFLILFSFISFFEGKDKLRNPTENTWVSLVILHVFILATILFYIFGKNVHYQKTIIISAIISKIGFATIIAIIAQTKNRDVGLWWFLGFLEYNSALIVLTSSDTLSKLKINKGDEFNLINEELKIKLDKLDKLYSDKILTEDEMKQKRIMVENEYISSAKEINSSNIESNNLKDQKELFSKLKEAYESGLLTDDEFKEKKEKLF